MQDMNVIENGMHFWAVITGICTRVFAVIPAKARIQVNPGRNMQCHAITDLEQPCSAKHLTGDGDGARGRSPILFRAPCPANNT